MIEMGLGLGFDLLGLMTSSKFENGPNRLKIGTETRSSSKTRRIGGAGSSQRERESSTSPRGDRGA